MNDEEIKDFYVSSVEGLQEDGNDSGWDTDLDSEDFREHFDPHKSNKEKYITACQEFGVIPASYFVRNMNNVRLNMAHHGFGVNGIKALSVALLTNTHLTGLDLCDNGMGTEGVSHLCEMLMENCYITDLDVSENDIGLEGVKSICQVLEHSDMLKRLTLKGNSLETKSAVVICDTLKHNTGLRYINLSHNLFGEEAGLSFGPVISSNEYLEEIDLSWNHLRRKGAFAIAKSLTENITLKKLDLSWNGFGDDGLYVLAEALKVNGSLQQLNISSNRVTHVGASHLQKCLSVNEGLLVLKVGQNPLQHGPTFILQGITSNLSSTIVELDLTDVQVTQEFVNITSSVKETNPKFTVYHGGLGGSPQKSAERPKPMKVLREFIKKNQMRVFDFFKSFDKDKSMGISIPEFVQGLKESGVPLRQDELYELVRSLDLDGDGEIDYKELLIGHQEAQKEERVEKLKEKADKKHKEGLVKNLASKPDSPSTATRKTRRVTTATRPGNDDSRPSSSVKGKTKRNDDRVRSKTFTPGMKDKTSSDDEDLENDQDDNNNSNVYVPPSSAPTFNRNLLSPQLDEKPPKTAS